LVVVALVVRQQQIAQRKVLLAASHHGTQLLLVAVQKLNPLVVVVGLLGELGLTPIKTVGLEQAARNLVM
jgi:hypothetical protein